MTKFPIIPPLLINANFIANFKEETDDFKVFANQCSSINSSSELLLNRVSIATSLLSTLNINESDILGILKSLDVKKFHGHDDTSIRMLDLSHKSILKPLKILFENCLRISRPMGKSKHNFNSSIRFYLERFVCPKTCIYYSQDH